MLTVPATHPVRKQSPSTQQTYSFFSPRLPLTVTKRRIETDVGQLPSANVFFLGRHVGEDDGGGGDAALLEEAEDVRLPLSRETEQPEHALGHAAQNAGPGFEDTWTGFVELIEVAENYAVLEMKRRKEEWGGKRECAEVGYHGLRVCRFSLTYCTIPTEIRS